MSAGDDQRDSGNGSKPVRRDHRECGHDGVGKATPGRGIEEVHGVQLRLEVELLAPDVVARGVAPHGDRPAGPEVALGLGGAAVEVGVGAQFFDDVDDDGHARPVPRYRHQRLRAQPDEHLRPAERGPLLGAQRDVERAEAHAVGRQHTTQQVHRR